ncbi:uncharacterized protein [Ptychodera flava]|uniref:uncharacterized protein isoform X5 n=1 Tax=Ptychodera flava TaxID=63121 RepID=UPI00396A112D
MAAARHTEMTNGPLQLSHDTTPRDYSQIEQSSNAPPPEPPSYRFQGYPGHSFFQPTKPVLGGPAANPIDAQNFHRPQRLIKDYGSYRLKETGVHSAPSQLGFYSYRAKYDTSPTGYHDSSQPVNGNNQGVQYSSDDVPVSIIQPPHGKKTLFRSDYGSAEERKRHYQKRDADEDIARFREYKQQQNMMAAEEKRKDLMMLKSYQPFGKMGGGAPPPNPRRTKNIMQMDYTGRNEIILSDHRNFDFGKPGAGAPRRSESGSVVTNLRSDNEIHFQKNKGGLTTINNHKRYTEGIDNARRYHNELENLALEQRTKKEIEKYTDREGERKSWDYNPFGKPGAGAPIKTDSGHLKAGRAVTLTNDTYEMRNAETKKVYRDMAKPRVVRDEPPPLWRESGNMEPEYEQAKEYMLGDRGQVMDGAYHTEDKHEYDPWGKGYGVPNRDGRGYVKRYKWGDPIGVREYVDPQAKGGALETKPFGGGGHLVDERGEKVTKFKTTMEQDKFGEPMTKPLRGSQDPDYHPWGKPGAGAPILADNGKVVTHTAGKMLYEQLGGTTSNPTKQEAKHVYLKELQNEMREQEQNRHKMEQDVKSGGIEVASWMRNGQVGYPKKDPVTGIQLSHPKRTSDVTAQRLDIRRQIDPVYSTDLERQATERHHIQAVAKKESANLAQKHINTMDTLWGRPGGGAPIGIYENRKQNLDMERSPQRTESFNPSTWLTPSIGKPQIRPWVRTKSLEKRFNSPKEIPGTQRSQPTVRAPWAVY